MNYLELIKATMGKEFIHKQTARVFTRTAFYFAAPKDEISNLLHGYEGTWMLRDKKYWKDGVYAPPKRSREYSEE